MQPIFYEGREKYMQNVVVVIGAGLMGSGIAACAALAGHSVALVDLRLEQAQKAVARALEHIDELYENGLATNEVAKKAKEEIFAAEKVDEFKDRAFLVIEAISEDLGAKQDLFASLDEIFPLDVPLLSNTSGLRITDIAAKTKHPERAVTAHFWFPAHLVPLVEVVVGDQTDLSVAEDVRDLLLEWGKAAVLVKKDLPGQLANRILQAVIRESVNIVEMGLASPEDVDTAVKMGMGIRFPVWGPLEHVDAVGLDLCENVQKTVLPSISAATIPSIGFAERIEKGDLGSKTGAGFYDWNVKSMDDLAARRNAFILAARKFMIANP